MNIGIATDHHGVKIKQELTKFLKNLGYNVIDYGPYTEDSVDYPDFAFKLAEQLDKEINLGILICNTGIGMSIACNKVKNARCAKVDNMYEAYMARYHNNANVIALSARKEIEELEQIIQKFLESPYSNMEKHNRRNEKIARYENKND
jgi:ribose 5-phosphate isomerase B